jgi:hypothetical protein
VAWTALSRASTAELADPPSDVMAARARAMMTDPPAAPWDGAWTLSTK